MLTRALASPVFQESDPFALSVRTDDHERVAGALAELARSEIAVSDFAFGRPSLDEVFLALTGRPAEDGTTDQEVAA